MRRAGVMVAVVLAGIVAASGTGLANAQTGNRATAQTATNTAALPNAPTAVGDSLRLGGSSRWDTAAAISKAHFPAPTYEVVVASGEDFPDALASGAYAAWHRAPVLLVPARGAIPASIAAELRRLQPTTITVAGSAGAVSDAMVDQLKPYAVNISRRGGASRWQTAGWLNHLDSKTVVIANGNTFADGLAGGAVAGRLGGGLLLTATTSLPEDTRWELAYAQPTKVFVLGSASVVSDGVISQIRAAAPSAVVTRVAGNSRFATAVAANKVANPGTADVVLLANGNNFPDALAAAPISALAKAPLLLTLYDCVPQVTLDEIRRLGATKVVALGSASAVSEAARRLTPC